MGVKDVEGHVVALADHEGIAEEHDPHPHHQTEFQRPAETGGVEERDRLGDPLSPSGVADRDLQDEGGEHGGHQ